MKETYIQPSTKAIKIQVSHMVMDSLPVDPNQETSTQLGREFSFFEEESDEEEPSE